MALLFGWGLFVLLGGGVLYYPGDTVGVAGGLRWLALLVAGILGGGFIWHSIRLRRGEKDDPRRNQRPGLVLAILGLLALVGSVPILRPWAYDGLAGGVRTVGLGAFLLGGGVIIAVGVACYRTHNQRIPLGMLAGLTGASVFYPLDASGITNGLSPLFWAAVVVFFIGSPAFTVYYSWPLIPETGCSDVG